MALIHTELCDIVGIKHPILQGGVVPYKTEALAIAVAVIHVVPLEKVLKLLSSAV